ncbi:hypothetical protein DEJ30_08010 [Curtobacterium sp. MCPF17_003]|nr:hypothetical protein DEJ30_08010 [Curtobacterium sp. MCPF17_003]
MRNLLDRLRAVRQRRRGRQERSRLSHAVFWPLRVLVDTFWAIIDAVLMVVLLLVVVVMVPIWLIGSFLS